MLPGFLLLKLPVATMVNGSVSLAGQNGLGREGAGKQDGFARAGKACRGLSNALRPQNALAQHPFSKAKEPVPATQVAVSRGRRRLWPPSETHSKLADWSRGAQPPPRPPPLRTPPPGRRLAHQPGVGRGVTLRGKMSQGVNRGAHSPPEPAPSGALGPADRSGDPHPARSQPTWHPPH